MTRHDQDWQLVDSTTGADGRGARESVYAVGNGYLGLRGAPDEGTPAHDPGVVLNGFHETWDIVYPEDAYGLARTGQTTVEPPDGTVIALDVDGEPFALDTAEVLRFERVLDMRSGVLRREVEWETASGARMLLRSSRLASLEDRHLAAIEWELVPLDRAVHVAVSSRLVTRGPSASTADPRRGKGFAGKVLDPVAAGTDALRAVLHLATRASDLHLVCGMDHRVSGPDAVALECAAAQDAAELLVLADLEPGQPLRLTKFVGYHWSDTDAAADLPRRVNRTLDRAVDAGYAAVEARHGGHVAAFWQRSDVEVAGPAGLQRDVRFNLFQLLQATAGGDGLGIPAKGVTGRGYEGQYFWDSEIYVVPFLTHTTPAWAKRALQLRCRMLEAARERAREVGLRGALYPWRTLNGKEASAWYAAGTAQYHIDADIAYAMHQYARVTGDLAFMVDEGVEVLVETARMWLSLGFYPDGIEGGFSIHAVTGPDEYTTVVDDNAYTNLMAKENLEVAVRVLEWLQRFDPPAHGRLLDQMGLSELEIASWGRAATHMHVPRDAERGIVLQDERFLARRRWDFENTPAEDHPLLLHRHPLELYRHQVIKQTDVVLATYLVGHGFTEDEVRRTFDYYDPLTTGDSSLSACVQSIVASQVGYPEAALAYFDKACGVDLHDAHGNTADGIHIASCGGTWLALVAGFGGLRDTDGTVRFTPRLPAGWSRLRFRVQVRGQLVEVDMTPAETSYRLLEGAGILVHHAGEELRLEPLAVHRRPCQSADRLGGCSWGEAQGADPAVAATAAEAAG